MENEHFHYFRFEEGRGGRTNFINHAVESCENNEASAGWEIFRQ